MAMAGDINGSVDHHRWSAIPSELLAAILRRVPSAADRVRVGSACTWWRSAARRLLPPSAPLLLIPYTENNFGPRRRHGWTHRAPLADTHESCVEAYCFRRQGRSAKKLIFGSSMGWLFTADRRGDVRLWNPLSGAEISLPPASALSKHSGFEIHCFFCVKKAVLSAIPSPTGGPCVAVIIRRCRETLSFCRVGDKAWTNFPELHIGAGRPALFDDVICYRSKFYAVTSRGEMVACDAGGPDPKLSVLSTTPAPSPNGHHVDGCCSYTNYLVESTSGELLMATRVVHWMAGYPRTFRFAVRKVDVGATAASASAEEMTDLGDQALLLGSSSSSSCTASEAHWCGRNRIYFLDDHARGFDRSSGYGDMGVFELEEGSIATFFNCCLFSHTPRFWIHGN